MIVQYLGIDDVEESIKELRKVMPVLPNIEVHFDILKNPNPQYSRFMEDINYYKKSKRLRPSEEISLMMAIRNGDTWKDNTLVKSLLDFTLEMIRFNFDEAVKVEVAFRVTDIFLRDTIRSMASTEPYYTDYLSDLFKDMKMESIDDLITVMTRTSRINKALDNLVSKCIKGLEEVYPKRGPRYM